MSRFYQWRDGKFVEVVPSGPREPVAPAIIMDTMTPCYHPATDQYVDSKSRFKQITKACGYEDRTGASAVADNRPKFNRMTEDDFIADVKIAREQLQSGTAPLTEYDKHVCKQIDERLKNKV